MTNVALTSIDQAINGAISNQKQHTGLFIKDVRMIMPIFDLSPLSLKPVMFRDVEFPEAIIVSDSFHALAIHVMATTAVYAGPLL